MIELPAQDRQLKTQYGWSRTVDGEIDPRVAVGVPSILSWTAVELICGLPANQRPTAEKDFKYQQDC